MPNMIVNPIVVIAPLVVAALFTLSYLTRWWQIKKLWGDRVRNSYPGHQYVLSAWAIALLVAAVGYLGRQPEDFDSGLVLGIYTTGVIVTLIAIGHNTWIFARTAFDDRLEKRHTQDRLEEQAQTLAQSAAEAAERRRQEEEAAAERRREEEAAEAERVAQEEAAQPEVVSDPTLAETIETTEPVSTESEPAEATDGRVVQLIVEPRQQTATG